KDNGGPTLTHALVKNSPALDAAPVDASCPATDQRGVPRPQGAACDIGAVEGIGRDQPPPPPPPPQPTAHNFVVSSVKTPKSIKHGGGAVPVTVTIRNASTHSETLSDSSVLGDGATTGLVRLDVEVIDTDGEQCEPPAVSLDGAKNGKLFSKGAKVLTPGASLTVNFLVTYRCDAPLPVNKRNREPGDYSNSASVFPDELDGISDSSASSTLAGAATKVTP
ncbi:MAG TPA: choice-of-anchor Q domain-containing protein, partial [Candidatus Binatia bacterium]